MMRALKNIALAIWRFFPIQMLVLALRKHHALLLIWIFLFAIIIGKVGVSLGVPYLFLDPEYLGNVGYLSFALVGMGFSALFVTWNVVNYMLHSHRFQFLASLENPLSVFFINNSIVPGIFLTGYVISIIRFQKYFEYQSWQEVILNLVGFFAGFTFILALTSIYFQIMNKSAKGVASSYKIELKRKKFFKRLALNEELEPNAKWRVDTFISGTLKLRHTRSVEHYEDNLNKLVFRQHHLNALIAQVATIILLIAIGFWVENPFFQIPTATSAFLLASVLTSLAGVFIFWTGGWGTFLLLVSVVIANQLTKYDIFGYHSRAHGLSYNSQPASYSLDTLRNLASEKNIESDKQYFIQILNKWKEKNTPKKNSQKPKIVFLTASGGGLRAAAFTMAFLQKADSLLNGSLLRKTFLMNGASGGTFAFALYRELYYRKLNGEVINMSDKKHLDHLCRDLLNPMCVNILSNDLFFPIHTFKWKGQKYFRDRGYMFERYFAHNTGIDFGKTLADYRKAEKDAQIPVMLFHTASTSDSRTFFISAHPVRFLMRPYHRKSAGLNLSIDGIDFGSFFARQRGFELNVLSAIRMSASFPYILPATMLPCEPPAYVIDGGVLDNFGIVSVMKFLINFKDWINENTSGVVIIQTRDSQKDEEPQETKQKTFIQQLLQPIGTLYGNMENIQDFGNDQKLAYINEELQGKIQFVLFEYIPEKKTEKASMSLRLTAREKREISRALEMGNNTRSFEKLKRLLAN